MADGHALPDPRAVRAAAANVTWCETVCRAHGIPSSVADGLWRAGRRPPPFYPDAITLRPGLSPAQAAAAVPPRAGASVKDSFGDLDLSGEGLDVLFEAQWVWLEAAGPGAQRLGGNGAEWRVQWTAVPDEAALRDWAAASGQPDTFVPALSREPGVRFLTAAAEGRDVGRAALCVGAGVVGLGNVWAGDERVWAALASAAREHFPGMPLAGYERGPELVAAIGAGFTAVGPLRVWARR